MPGGGRARLVPPVIRMLAPCGGPGPAGGSPFYADRPAAGEPP
ncbi:hypothetical protein IBTHAUMO2_1130048 [Nitrosopumilaceae archaeon]|nr:hypothetical protein IBTHAUMO2_1130048 [Nitrosopumilaceae archaeon]